MGPTPSPSSLPPPATPLTGAPAASTGLILKPGAAWADAWDRCVQTAPEAFTGHGRIRSLLHGTWHDGDDVPPATSPLDGTPIARPAASPASAVREAVSTAGERHRAWRHVPLPERGARIAAALDALAEHRTLLALLQVWESGTPWKHAQWDVDRAVDRVRRAVGEAGHEPGCLPGPAAYIAEPHETAGGILRTMLTRALAGNAVVVGTAGGPAAASLSLACALCVREGLPFTLVGGRGACDAVTQAAAGGRCFLERPPEATDLLEEADGRAPAARAPAVVRTAGEPSRPPAGAEPAGSRPDCWGVWACSDWEAFGRSVRPAPRRAGRPAVCSRFVVQRSLLDDFLEAYLPALRSLRYGHPLAVASPEDPCPALDFGPLPDAGAARQVHEQIRQAVAGGAVLLHQGLPEEGGFLPGQDTSAYVAPAALLSPPPGSPLNGAQPHVPLGTVVLVDTEAEFAEAMNASAAASVTRLTTDDPDLRERLARELHSGPPGTTADPAERGTSPGTTP